MGVGEFAMRLKLLPSGHRKPAGACKEDALYFWRDNHDGVPIALFALAYFKVGFVLLDEGRVR